MPSKSEVQQQAAGAALSAKRGETDPSKLKGASKQMYDDMTEKQLRDFAKTKHDNIPHKVEEGEIPSNVPDELQTLLDKYDESEIKIGMDVEQEHNRGNTDVVQSPLDTLKIVLAHMKEDPKYYTHLKAMEDKYSIKEGAVKDAFVAAQGFAKLEKNKESLAALMTLHKNPRSKEALDNFKVIAKKVLSGAEYKEIVVNMMGETKLPVKKFAPILDENQLKVGDKVKSKNMPNTQLWVSDVPKGKDYVFVVDKKNHENKMLVKDLVKEMGMPALSMSTTPGRAFDFEDHDADLKDAPAMKKECDLEGDVDDIEDKKDDLIFDEEMNEAEYKFKNSQTVKYNGKSWKVLSTTKDWVEIEDSRGYTKLIDFSDIKSFSNNTIVTEAESTRESEILERMSRVAGYEYGDSLFKVEGE